MDAVDATEETLSGRVRVLRHHEDSPTGYAILITSWGKTFYVASSNFAPGVFELLRVGTPVTFTAYDSPRGPCAADVKIVDEKRKAEPVDCRPTPALARGRRGLLDEADAVFLAAPRGRPA